MEINLNQTEKDFIEFISKKRSHPYKEIENIYLSTKNRFEFSNSEYRKLNDSIHNLFKLLYDDKNEQELIGSYRFHALMHLFRFISYSYSPKAGTGKRSLSKALIKDILDKLMKSPCKLQGITKLNFLKKLNEDTKTIDSKFSGIAEFLVKKINKPPIVVDYGCALGYISFEIGMFEKNSKIYLVDVDCLSLEFVEFRFKKHGINVKTIPVSKNNIYPKLPKHNICIATEVMEHVIQPLKVYQNIKDSLEVRGIIYGNFEDHKKETFHVSPNLGELRCRLNEDFERIGDIVYRKIK